MLHFILALSCFSGDPGCKRSEAPLTPKFNFLGENIVHPVFLELYYVLTGKYKLEYSVYFNESSQNLDLTGLILQSWTISIPHEVYSQVTIPHGLQGL